MEACPSLLRKSHDEVAGRAQFWPHQGKLYRSCGVLLTAAALWHAAAGMSPDMRIT